MDWLLRDLLILIPLISSVVGWGTNVLAVEMMFYPLRFVGIPPVLGWQGIIPANALELAGRSSELITSKLISLRMLFEDFDPEDFAPKLDPAVDQMTEQIIEETAGRYASEMWSGMAPPARAQIQTMVRGQIRDVSVQILGDLRDRIEEIIDLKETVVDVARRDRRIIGDIFLQVGTEEFAFIKRSGAYFGLLFGLVQMAAWKIYPAWWVLPLFGFFVGYATNWLAIKLIFDPKEARRIGPFVVQGLFHKRQKEVSGKFSEIVSERILNPDNLVRLMIADERGEKLFAIVENRVGALLDNYQQNPMMKGFVPDDQWSTIRAETFSRMRTDLAQPGGFFYLFTAHAIDVHGELFHRMVDLDADSFESVLRPAFQKDEWKLILTGGALGLAAGVLQVVYLFGDQI